MANNNSSVNADAAFTLRNDPPRPAKRTPLAAPRRDKQLPLFRGLDCLPGQQDLFDAGEIASPAPRVSETPGD
jgi:hypothetical protein